MKIDIACESYKLCIYIEPFKFKGIHRSLGLIKNDIHNFDLVDVKTGSYILKNIYSLEEINSRLFILKDILNNISIEKEKFLIANLNSKVYFQTYKMYLKDFIKIFFISSSNFLDINYFINTGKRKFDINKFEKYINETHTHYKFHNGTLVQFIMSNHGDYAVTIIKYFMINF